MFKSLVKLKKRFVRNLTLHHLILPFFLILALSITLPSIASTELSFSPNAKMTFEKTVDSGLAKPSDRINFTITYSNPMTETAYNVTIFEWMPSDLTFISSKPFYDGVSDPETGFYRWSRGNVQPNGEGTVTVKAMVNNVPVGTVITNTAHLSYEFENGTSVEVTSSAKITVTQAAGVDVYPDQIHSVGPYTDAWTEFNVTLTNTGNGLDTFNISLRSVAYNPSSSTHEWMIELYNSTGYPINPVVTVCDDNQYNRTSWTDHGVLTNVTLSSGESTWFIIMVTEAGGTSGSGDAYLDVQLAATSLLDPSVSDSVDKMTIVKSVAGITLAPNYLKYANPGDSVVFRHILVNSGQTEVVDLKYRSPRGWNYSFWFDNGTALKDTDGSGYVDVGLLHKNAYVHTLVKVTVPYGTAAAINDTAEITAIGVTSGNFDTANDITVVNSALVLGVHKKLVSDNPKYVGDFVTYRINITNLGNTRLTKIPLDDAFETLSLNFSSADPAQDVYDETAGTIHWENLTALESGQSLVVTVNFVATAGDNIVRQSANVIDAEDEFGNLISATYMNRELKIIGVYTLTVTASPSEAIGASFGVTWTERGVRKDNTFTTQKTIMCDQDTTAEVSYPESPFTKGDVRYVFTHYSPSATVTMDSDKTVTLNYRTEYTLTFKQVGSYEPVYITVDGHQLPEALPQSLWVWKDSTITFSYPSPVTDTAGTTRYVLTGVSGNTTDTSVTVNAPTIVTGFYKTEYYLNVTTDPLGLDAPQYSGWYDEGAYAKIEVETPTGGDGVSTRYWFHNWTGTGIVDAAATSTTILMDAPKVAEANFIEQFYLTMSTNFGVVSPDSGWYDAGLVVSIEASAPAVAVGKGYVWHGWTGTGEGSYSGLGNPATVTMYSAISETAYWKISPILTIMISNDTIASGDEIVVYGKALPVSSSVRITVTYVLPNGTQIEHTVYTNDEGDYEDGLLVGSRYLYNLFVNAGEWVITARRSSDFSHEAAEASTTLKIGAPAVVQVHPALLAGLIVAAALIAYVMIIRKVKNNKNAWWRATVILCCTGLIFGATSLALNWVFVTGTVAIENTMYQVDVLLYPFTNGLVSLTKGIRYIGSQMPPMVDLKWQNISGSSGPVLSLWLIPVGCSLLLLAGLYKPKNVRQRNLKVAILVISGLLIVTSVVQALVFVQGQVSTLEGAGIGYGAGVYLAIIGGTLTLLSGLFANRETLVKPEKAKKS